jgi:hypothetical protein
MIGMMLVLLSACGGFGGRYPIQSKPMDEFRTNLKIPLDVRLILDSDLCGYVYVSKRQGAKRVYELGDALCTNTANLCKTLFRKVTVVKGEERGVAGEFDVIIVPKVIDTSVLVRPGAPPNFEATMIYECAITDPKGRPIFLRTVKENKTIERYGYDSYGVVMQAAVDELFSKLGSELAHSPEIRKYVDKLN